MSTLDKLHDQAMEVAFFADLERRKGNEEHAAKLFEQALDLERQAIAAMTSPVEPTWSILHRSAGWLALDCNQPRLAEQLACTALTGVPSPKIADELRDLWEQANFHRHLGSKGFALRNDELQLSLAGREVGGGIAEWSEVYGRLNSFSQLIYRTVERKQNRPFRERGLLPKNIRENHQMLVSAPRNGSFAVTLKFGSPTEPSLPGILDTEAIIGEFMDLIEMLNRSRVNEIQEIIPDPAYLRNFFGLAKKIAPDGERVRQVGFTTIRSGVERSVELTTPAGDFPAPLTEEQLLDVEAEPIKIRGILQYADAINRNEIRVVDDKAKRHAVVVPEGLMNDIVRPMWNSRVVIDAIRTGNIVTLKDIQPDDQD